MLQTTINSYLYQQYADDDNLQAFVGAYNLGTQYYLDWFTSVGLPYYPGLSAPLLDWVAEGVYGFSRSALAVQTSAGGGPLNTVMLNQPGFPLNAFAFPTTTYYALTDDALKRILTWNFFKGDGKRFCPRWLKRRVMRFLAGANGVDPEPWSPGFVVGAENTSAISAQISSGFVCTVTINQSLLSAQLGDALAPGILTIFQLAFQGGQLDLPVEFTYVCNVQTSLVASMSPTAVTSIGTASSQTTPAATVSLSGGSGDYTYAWVWKSGGTGITTTSPTAASTTFSASGLVSGTGVSGVAVCTVTDIVTSLQASAQVTVGIECAAAIVATASPTSLTVTSASATESAGTSTVTATGGITPYTYAWTWQTGGTGIEISAPTAATTGFSTIAQSAGTTLTGTALCTVTDSFSQTGTATVAISITRVSAVSAVAAPTSLSVTGGSAAELTGDTTVTASSGQSPYTYTWSWQSGGSGITIEDPGAATTDFGTSALPAGTTYSGVAVCVVKDVYGQTATPTVSVSITRTPMISAVVSPSIQVSSGIATTQTTGTSVVTASGGGTSYTYAWQWTSTTGDIAINSPSSASTSFTGSGMTNGNVYSGVAQCTVTDQYSQQTVVTVSVSITCSATLYDYSNQAATTFTIPNDVSALAIENWGPGAGGVAGSGSVCGGPAGAGGGAGGYARSEFSISSASWGKTIAISATNAIETATKVSSGTYSLTTLTANPGNAGTGATPGTGGTASGGTQANTTGHSGSAPPGGGSGGAGGVGTTGINGGPYGAGGRGGGSGNHPPEAAGGSAGVVIKVS